MRIQTKLRVQRISVEEMLARKEQEYNPATWKESVLSLTKFQKLQFYVIEPDEIYSYARFFCSYVADNLHLFRSFSAYSNSLTNNGFCMIFIDDEGNIEKELFGNGYAANTLENRKILRRLCAPHDIMISTNF